MRHGYWMRTRSIEKEGIVWSRCSAELADEGITPPYELWPNPFTQVGPVLQGVHARPFPRLAVFVGPY